MEGHSDWDLLAVVRSCTTTMATTTATTAISPLRNTDYSPPPLAPPELPQPPILPQQEELICFTPTPSTCSTTSALFGFSSPLPTTSFLSGGQQELLQENINTSTNNFQSLSCSSTVSHQQEQLRRLIRPSHVTFGTSSPTVTTSRGGATSSLRTKKRKNLMKKVCHVPAEGLFSDMWAWRKYGQKPIKGSPHPRGYYKCSSSKGCLARKQVERNRTDPKMFIVTYTSEHNHPIPTHRNSLAGSTRQKGLTSSDTPADQPTCSSPSMTNQSPVTEAPQAKTEGENLVQNEDNDLRGLSDLMFNDDFYVGFEQIDGGSDDSDCFPEQFSSSLEFPWLDNGSITATATGGS